MQLEELNEWGEEFAAFHERFADLFEREEPREQVQKYLRSLLASVERKNGWQLAEISGDKTPDATQRLLYQAKWDADKARDRLQQFVVELFGDEEGIGVVDETGFIKKGDKSVGVQRQYSGTAGKRENCQIGTFLSYATVHGHVFLDRRLYLPESWSTAPERRVQAKVPASVVFESKPQQAVKMLQHAWEMGVPMRWVTGDEVYGDPSQVRDAVAESGRYYVLAVRTHLTVWPERPEGSRSQSKNRSWLLPIPSLSRCWQPPGPQASGSDWRLLKARRVLASMTGRANALLRTKINCPDAMLGSWCDVRPRTRQNLPIIFPMHLPRALC